MQHFGITIPYTIAPILSAGSASRTSDTEATIDFTTDEDGTAFYTVVDKNASAKDIYVVVKNVANNISIPLKIEVAAYVPPAQTVANEGSLEPCHKSQA